MPQRKSVIVTLQLELVRPLSSSSVADKNQWPRTKIGININRLYFVGGAYEFKLDEYKTKIVT